MAGDYVMTLTLTLLNGVGLHKQMSFPPPYRWSRSVSWCLAEGEGNGHQRRPIAFWLGKDFYAPQLVPPGTAEARISYGNSVRLSVRLSRSGGIPSPGEIETPGLHHMVAWII